MKKWNPISGADLKALLTLLLGCIACLAVNPNVLGQTYTLSGTVTETEAGDPIPGAKVIVEGTSLGALTDSSGRFELDIPFQFKRIIVQQLYYVWDTLDLKLEPGKKAYEIKVNLELQVKETSLDAVEITDLRSSLTKNQMSFTSLSIERIKHLPVFLGEVDILKTLQLLPGIQSGSEASSGLYVRGGGPDQNLMLFDDAPLYNVSHLFGFFSIFNGEVVDGVDLYKGAFPARYGGRLSSVVDVKPRKGDFREFHAHGGIGLISSRLALEGPIAKDKLSFLAAGRRTYADVFTRQINKWNEDDPEATLIPDYFFHDFNARLDWKPTSKDHISLSGYMGKDDFEYLDGNYLLEFFWRNRTASLNWDHLFSEKAVLHASAVFNRFDYDITNQYVTHEVSVFSDIRDFSGNLSIIWQPDPRHTVEAGISHTHHTFTPRGASGSLNQGTFELTNDASILSHENGVFISDDLKISDRAQLAAGLRLSSQWLKDTAFINPEPRLSFLYRVGENITAKASYTRMAQYLHLVSNSSISLPTDIWYPSTPVALPEISDQGVLGATALLFQNHLELTIEGFAKYNRNLVEYKEGTQFLFSEDLESDFTFGRGWSYGGEFFLQKKRGAFTGWIGYTLSWSFRQFDQINYGKVYRSKYDRRHDISIVGNWEVSPRITLSAAWIYGTGSNMTLPIGRYFLTEIDELEPEFIPHYTERNAYRLPAYHRLDLGCTWNLNPQKGHSKLVFNVFNAYNRGNIFFIYFDEVKDANDIVVRYQAKKVSLFPVLPSISYNFNF